METVTVSPKYQVVIPRAIRRALAIHPGQKLQVIQYAHRIKLVPLQHPRDLRGFLKGIDTTMARDEDQEYPC